MAQLWASHAHEGKSPFSSTTLAFLLLSPPVSLLFSVSVHNSDSGRHRRHRILMTFVTVSSCPKPRRLVPLCFIAYTSGILFHFCLSAGGCAPGSVLYASRFLRPPPVSYFCLSCVTVIYLPPSCSFFELPVQHALCLCLCLSPALLFHNISLLTYLMNTVLDTHRCACVYI